MAKYAEGTVSPNGKWVVQGGQWVANAAAPPPAFSPTMASAERTLGPGSEPVPGPPSLGMRVAQTVLPPIAKGLEYASIPFLPLEAASKAAEQGLEKVAPGITKDIEVPLEGLAPEAFGGKPTGQTITSPGAGKTAVEAAGWLAMGPYARGLGSVAKGALKSLPGLRAAAKIEAPLTQVDPDINASADALLKQLGGTPAAAEAAPEISSFAKPEPAMGSLFGGPREAVQRPAVVPPMKAGGPSPGAQGSLFSPAALSPPTYGPGRGLVEPPPPPTPRPGITAGGNVPRERWGTEAARLKREIQDIERLRGLIGSFK